jgi:transcriptional regulator GlxA family with amidase domain
MMLVDGFSLMSYATIIEPFRAANRLSGQALYAWPHASADGGTVRASTGAAMLVDHAAGDELDCDILFVFAAGNPSQFRDSATFHWLRRLAASGVVLAGVSGGPFLLARAGLLDGHRATIHWEHEAGFAEEFPRIISSRDLYVIDRRRITCAGGTAGLDLAVDLIERDHGRAFATRVREWFIGPDHRAGDRPQRRGLSERFGVADTRLLKALACMDANMEIPLARDALAAAAGISLRQLERLFRSAVGGSIAEVYLLMRLDKARTLLSNSSIRITAIGLACGFQDPSHFSRAYRLRFGHSPRDERQRGANMRAPVNNRATHPAPIGSGDG